MRFFALDFKQLEELRIKVEKAIKNTSTGGVAIIGFNYEKELVEEDSTLEFVEK